MNNYPHRWTPAELANTGDIDFALTVLKDYLAESKAPHGAVAQKCRNAIHALETLKLERPVRNAKTGELFTLTIGDWSGDGHEMSVPFTVSVNKTLNDVREAHFRIADVTGVDIEAVCSGYCDSYIAPEDAKKLTDLGYVFNDSLFSDLEGEIAPTPEGMADIWLFLLMKADPELKLALVPAPEELPQIHFYGWDSQNRHIGCVGYGVFH